MYRFEIDSTSGWGCRIYLGENQVAECNLETAESWVSTLNALRPVSLEAAEEVVDAYKELLGDAERARPPKQTRIDFYTKWLGYWQGVVGGE